jgi:hypothetical protein
MMGAKIITYSLLWEKKKKKAFQEVEAGMEAG